MYAVMALLVVAIVSLLITRVATIALTVTGMPRPSARFQARSALSGVGFTTSEAESVVNHPVRRRIIMALMLVGNVGLATAVAGLLAGYAGADLGAGASRTGLLVVGLIGIYAVSKSDLVDRRLSRLIAAGLKRYTDLDVRDYDRLLRLSGEYGIQELPVAENSWLAEHTLGDLRLRDEGVIVLGVARADGSYLGVPGKETQLHARDSLIVYGRDSTLLGLSKRPANWAGHYEHRRAVEEQVHVAAEEEAAEAPAADEELDDHG